MHDGEPDEIEHRLQPLGLGAIRLGTSSADDMPLAAPIDPVRKARTLWLLLAINGTMFVLELGSAWLAESAGLLADSLDMFADAVVYGLALPLGWPER